MGSEREHVRQQATCGYCSGHRQTSDHKRNVVGFMVKQSSLCGPTLETCPNCRSKNNAFSNRCMKKAKAPRAVRPSRMIGQPASTNAATGEASGTNRVVVGPRPKGAAEEGGGRGSEAEMVEVWDKEATWEAEDITMTESANITATVNAICAETEIGPLATND
jgi:hypothetical protein